MMRIETLAAALLSIILGAAGQLFLKLGATRLFAVPRQDGLLGFMRDFIMTWQLSLGLLFYGSSAFVWIYVLSKVSLSVAYPMVGLSFVVVLMLSVLVLGETVKLGQIMGCGLILAGIVMVTHG
ncbi:EamA family transporter [Haematobacter massiliensis]|uniref:EamA family transporter n=1 Tax=Haematobacter massiliensis TaxID=195105 RepID=UPI0013F15623|nr:EamA family transporter [Haematobacter massiliensis]